jgi:hypothetical protein
MRQVLDGLSPAAEAAKPFEPVRVVNEMGLEMSVTLTTSGFATGAFGG